MVGTDDVHLVRAHQPNCVTLRVLDHHDFDAANDKEIDTIDVIECMQESMFLFSEPLFESGHALSTRKTKRLGLGHGQGRKRVMREQANRMILRVLVGKDEF